MLPAVGSIWPVGYGFYPFRVETTDVGFPFSRRAAGTNPEGCKGSNISAVWTPRHHETLINGVLQGRRQNDRRGASALSRMHIWDLFLETIGLIDVPALRNILGMSSYLDMKRSQALEHRRLVNEDVKSKALKGWNNPSADTLLESISQP